MWQIEDSNLISYSGDETDLVIPEGIVQAERMEQETRPRIVALGGSFNPPTAAHLALLKAAVEKFSFPSAISSGDTSLGFSLRAVRTSIPSRTDMFFLAK